MRSTGIAPPQDEDWQLEWRWGAAHPWLRPKGGAPSSPFSDASVASSAAPHRPSRNSHSASSSSSSVSACCCASGPPSVSSFDSSLVPLEPSPSPSSSTSVASPPVGLSPVHNTSTKENDTSTPAGAATPSSTTFSTLLWPLSSTFSQLFRRAQTLSEHAVSQRELTAEVSPRAAAADTPAPATWIANAAAESAPLATPSATSAPAAAEREGELLRENASTTAAAGAILLTTEAGAEKMRSALQHEVQDSGARMASAATPVPAPEGPRFWEATSAAMDESKHVPRRKEVADEEAKRKREMLETGVAVAGVVAAPSGLSVAAASAAASATSGATAGVDNQKRELQNNTGEVHEPKRVQQLLLQFGDQTLNFIQRQQMKLWSYYAFRDWRVKTLVHALSAMGEPVNLVVVNCTPPPPSSVSLSPSSSSSSSLPSSSLRPSSSSVNASDCSAVSSSTSRSNSPTSPSFSSRLTFKPPGHSPSYTASEGEKRTPWPPADYSLSAEHRNVVASDARAAAAPPTSRSPAGPTSSVSAAASETSLPAAIDTGQPLGRRVATTTKGEAPLREAEVPLLSSASPIVGEDVVRGGYSPLYHTVWLCGNRLWSPFELRRVLLHELVHAFDFARANISPNDCRHVACTEIRAYNLSGQCGWWRTRSYDIEQFNTVQPLLTSKGTNAAALREGQQQEEGAHAYDSGQWQPTKRNRCLTHGALNSLRQHRRCHAPGVAENAVRDVFTRCVRDTWPFLAPPERDSKWRPSRMWRPEAEEYFKK